MALAVLRGCKFKKYRQHNMVVYDTATDSMVLRFEEALNDVAQALGYYRIHEYTAACVNDPHEVRRRIRALEAPDA